MALQGLFLCLFIKHAPQRLRKLAVSVPSLPKITGKDFLEYKPLWEELGSLDETGWLIVTSGSINVSIMNSEAGSKDVTGFCYKKFKSKSWKHMFDVMKSKTYHKPTVERTEMGIVSLAWAGMAWRSRAELEEATLTLSEVRHLLERGYEEMTRLEAVQQNANMTKGYFVYKFTWSNMTCMFYFGNLTELR